MLPESGRQQQLRQWLAQVFPNDSVQVTPLAGDASFRHYYRVKVCTQSHVVMDAPPPMESLESFIQVDHCFASLGLCVPDILAEQSDLGFLLLSDFGDHLLGHLLNEHTADDLYQRAFTPLYQLQTCSPILLQRFPPFSADRYRGEINLFTQWFLPYQLQHTLSAAEQTIIEQASELLIKDALAQPQILVHRDYHSRNLLLLESGQIGVIDFQDAVVGPISYDIVSLLRDCYIDWPLPKLECWLKSYYDGLVEREYLRADQWTCFRRWFDWIGLQRHLKCIGIFSRLKHRDQKPDYLAHIPRILGYAKTVCERYQEFTDLGKLISQCIRKIT